MSWICLKVRTFFQPFFAAVLMLTIVGCANTGSTRQSANGQMARVDQPAVPEYVRNLPKSRTGNMAEYTVFGKRYTVLDSAAGFSEQGTASWYGKEFHGRKTSSGEIYDMHAMTAAHKNLPLPTFVRVTNLENNHSVVVKVNDRGPFVGNRIIDLSLAAAVALDMQNQGTANVYIEALSTHLIAENDDSSNKGVVESFAKEENNDRISAPEVIEPTLAAVPLVASPEPQAVSPVTDVMKDALVAIEKFETDVEPAMNADIVNEIENNSEGYVELVAKADTALITAPAVEQPIEVEEMVGAKPPELGKASVGVENYYFIQLGAFGYAPNAESMVNDVAEKIGLTAFIEKDQEIELYRVKMGPYEAGEMLDTTMTQLAGIGIDGYTRLAVKR